MDQVTYGSVKPISPETCFPKIPDHIIEIFNSMIEENLDANGKSILLLKDVKARILNSGKPFESKWLNVEAFYKNAGWKVNYERPCYGDSDFNPYYEFSKINQLLC
jgi:hypothetical protein